MKKFLFITLVLIFCCVTASSQSCLQEGIEFQTQAQIDSFQIMYPNCTEIEGGVEISGSDITNLNGLSVLSTIGGTLHINNTNLLANIAGLENLTYIGEIKIIDNEALTSLASLNNINSIYGSIIIEKNDAMTSLTGLDNISLITGSLVIWENAALNNLNALSNLQTIIGGLLIEDNDALITLTGVNNLGAVGNLYIQANDSLISLTALENLIYLDSEIHVSGNNSLTSLAGLENIYHGFNHLQIASNNILSTCDVLSICDYLANPPVYGEIEIFGNASGCNSQEEIVEACESSSITEKHFQDIIEIYPNPAHQELNITAEDYVIDEVCIYTLTGQKILQERPVGGTMDISALPAGMYIVEVTVENTRIRQKLLVQR